MDQIAVVILLVVGVPAALGIWLISRALADRSRIEELTRRVDELQSQLARLKAPPGTQSFEEKRPGFMPADLPTRRDQVKVAPPVTPPPVPTGSIQPPPLVGPASPERPAPITPLIPPLPAAPPPVMPQRTAPAARPQEPVLRTAPASPNPAGESPAPEQSSFEMRLGTYWLVRVGVVMLLAGLAFFANYAYHNFIGQLGAAGKISLLYLASGLLLGAGAWWQRRNVKEPLKNYGNVLFAGGLAAVYFTTYAAHHLSPLRIIGSALLDGTLLLAWAGVIAWIADYRKSEVMALFAVGLAFFTSVITRVGEFTLYSNLILTLAAVVFLLRNRWAGLSFASLITSYAGYAFWRFLRDDGWHWAAPDENLLLGAGFLASYWLVFTVATFLSRSDKLSGSGRAAFLTLNNGAFFALYLLTMLQVRSGGFWEFSLAYGSVLLALAALANKFLPAEPPARNSYLTHGLVLLTLGFITKFAGLQLALVLGSESVVLFVLGAQRPSQILKFFAYAAALLAVGWCGASQKKFDPPGAWTGAGVGALLAFNAFWAHRQSKNNPALLRGETTAFTLLALASWFAATWFNTAEAAFPLALAAETVVLTFSIYWLRVREITLLGQSFIVFAQVAWLSHFMDDVAPWWNPLAMIGVTIGLSHWWQHQKILPVSRNAFVGGSTLFALAVIAVILVWLHPLVPAPEWLVLTSLLAVAVTAYGLLTRAWPLAVCGQIFLAVSAWEFLQQLFQEKPDWYFPLAPMFVLGGLSLATVRWFARQPDAARGAREPLLQLATVYRWLALAMSLVWVWEYIPERQRVWILMLAACAVFGLAVWRCSREALAAATVYGGASVLLLWLGENAVMDIYAPNLLSLVALVVMQQILRRASAKLPLADHVHGATVIIAGLSLWRFATCWASLINSGFFVTMTWAGFAVAVLAVGMVLRERFFRWFGLGVFAAAVGRVVLVDVWKQETIYRVLTFMALGAALLVVGFIYNKYQEKIRHWL